ncbi:MAG: N-formylglutamate amidohydrolase [Alphaproteobacteria bacterium]|nr:N-formylglutamate amidohydrolase [Alphaproteobacteria bacterium]
MDPTDLGSSAAPAAADGESQAVVNNEPPFVLIEPLRRTTPLIFASPHSGRRYPAELLADARVSLISLRRSEDAYVDELFAGAAAHGACVLSGTVARAYVDLNRDPAELDPDMFDERPPQSPQNNSARVQAGLGAIPRISGDGQTIYRRKLALSEAERRINTVHRPYHTLLQSLVAETKEQFGCAVLIDCHSMPNNARGAHAPDVVLGDRFGASCHPSVTALAEVTLRRLGYRVARNTPFAGGHTTQSYGRPAAHVHALQIEINRALYVDERTLERTNGYARVRADMTRLAEALSAANLHKSLA